MSYHYREQLALARRQQPPPTAAAPWKIEKHPGFVRHVCTSLNSDGERLWTGYSTALRTNQNKPAMYTPSMHGKSYAELVQRLKEPEKQLKRY